MSFLFLNILDTESVPMPPTTSRDASTTGKLYALSMAIKKQLCKNEWWQTA